MKKVACLCALALLVLAGPVAAADVMDDPMGDLNVTASATSSRGVRTPEQVLDDIQKILDELYSAMGRAYTKETDPKRNQAEDTQWQQNFEDANRALRSLWQEFSSAVKGDKDRRTMDRDEAFRGALAQAYQAYRNQFGALDNDPSRVYEQLLAKAAQKRYRLVRERKWLDPPTLTPASGLSGVGYGDPTKWDDNDLVFAVGLLPKELLDDVNMNIRTAYHYGYLRQKNAYQLSDPAFSTWNGVDWTRVSYDTAFDDDYYYSRIYNASFLLSNLTDTFGAMQPHTGSLAQARSAMERSVGPAEAALARAESFKSGKTAITSTRNGEMLLAKSVSDDVANAIRDEYQKICDDFKVAMSDYKRYLDEFRRNFPGEATGQLQQAMQKTYNDYRKGFMYNEVDQLALRFERLRETAGRFVLKRKGMFSIDKSLERPSSWSKPRKELYSAQRVIGLLPPDMRTEIDRRRQRAFQLGASAAKLEYDRLQSQTVQPNTNGGTWNDTPAPSNNGGTWNDTPAPTNNGGSWNDTPAPTNNGGSWNDTPAPTNNGGSWNDTPAPSNNGGSWNDN